MIRKKGISHKVFRSALYGLYLFLAVWVLLEVALRIYNPFGMRVKGDKILLPVNQTLTINNHLNPKLDPVIIHSKNGLGFRGPEIPAEFNSQLSLITVGGSTTACSFLNNDRTWPFLLGQHLEKDFRNIWLNNAGIDGHSSFGHQVLLSDYIVHLHPKVVLFLTGVNDLENEATTFHDRLSIKGLYPGLKHYLYNNSEVVNVVVDLFRGYRARKMNNTTHLPKDLVAEYPLLTKEQREEKLLAQDKFLTGYQRRLTALIDTCLVHQIYPVFITQPLLYGTGTDSITGVDLARTAVPFYVNGAMVWDVLQLYNDKMKSVCREKNIPCIDLAARMPKNSLYFYDGSHFTNQGASVVATIISEELQKILSVQFPSFKLATFDPSRY